MQSNLCDLYRRATDVQIEMKINRAVVTKGCTEINNNDTHQRIVFTVLA